jgi:hypothetical protein
MSRVFVLLMTIDVVVVVCRTCPDLQFVSLWGASTPPFISKGGELTRKVTKSVIT